MPNAAPPRRPRFAAPALRARFAAALFPLAALAACGGGDNATGPGSGISGTYALRTVQGQSLPIEFGTTDDGRVASITAGNVDLRSDNSWSSSLTFSLAAGGQASSQSQQDGGTYTVSGSTVSLQSREGDVTTATVNSGRLTGSIALEGGGSLELVYEK